MGIVIAMPTKPTLSVIVKPPQKTVARHAEAFCSRPWENSRLWLSDDCYFDDKAGCVFVNPEWTPSNFAWTKADYNFEPDDDSAWIEAQDALGKGDYGVAFAGNTTYPVTTPWFVVSTNDAAHQVKRNQGVIFSFTWHRPSSDVLPNLTFYPRLDMSKWVMLGQTKIIFAPFMLAIDSDLRMRVYEYPYDTYDPWIANNLLGMTEVYRHPMVVNAQTLADKWHTLWVQPISNDEVRVVSDILQDNGFSYRSIVPRNNIQMSPAGVAAVKATQGGIGVVNICPLTMQATGTFRGPKQSKSVCDGTYPSLKVFGWSPTVINTNNGYLDNQVIDLDTGFGGITYKIYSVVTDPATGVETETLVPTSDGPEFKNFKVEITLTPYEDVSQVINDLVVDFAEDTQTNTDPSIDASADVVSISESVSADFGSFKTKLVIRNQNGVYDSIATRPVNEIDLDIAGVDRATLFTLNPGYDWLKTPRHGALTLEWDCGDGFAYLQRELLAKHPAYDGMLLSDCLTEFMARIGYTLERVDIDATPGVYLPKKRGKDKLFKPEDGSSAVDFLKQLHEWFQSDWTCRFDGDGRFVFKDASAMTVARTYYPASAYKPTPDDYVIYGDAKVELMHDQFYNEIWVVGKDTRNNKPIVMVYQDLPSQTDKNAPDYVGRRLLMIVITKANREDAVWWILYNLALHYGQIRTRVTFNTRVDPNIHEQDFIKIHGVSHLWRIQSITNDVQVSNVASSVINTTTPVIRGSQITAIQWPTVI